ncbi:MAG: S8 family serine peptidase [Bdellovibrionaceae bacterium]|nr:S8 family serine peptidase [Pseudobdellovibrionaceae bacterium]
MAGIIGARGGRAGMQGVAPAADLRSVRVFLPGSGKTNNFLLGEGIKQAARTDVHLINISIVTKYPSAYLGKAVALAYQNGAVCIAATGNDDRDIVYHRPRPNAFSPFPRTLIRMVCPRIAPTGPI